MCHWAMAEEGRLLRETSAIASPQRMLQALSRASPGPLAGARSKGLDTESVDTDNSDGLS